MADHPSSDPEALLEDAVTLARTRPLSEARARFREAEDAFAAAGASARVAQVLIEEARVLAASFRRVHLDEAQVLLQRAERLLGEEDAAGTRAALHHVRGYALVRAGALLPAEDALRRAEALYRAAGDTVGEARVLDTLGVLFERTADRERAALLLAHSHALKQRAGDEEGVAISLGNLGRLALHGGNAREAEPFFRLDLDLVREQGNVRAQGVLLTNLAECALEQGDAERARGFAEEALAHAEATDNTIGVGYARLALAEAAMHADTFDPAAVHVDVATRAFAESGMLAGLAAARLVGGRVAVARGNAAEGCVLMARAARAARRVAQHEVAARALLALFDETTLHGAEPFGGRALRTLARAHDDAARSGLPQLERAVRQRRLRLAHTWALDGAAVPVEPGVGTWPAEVGALRATQVLGAGAEATVLEVRTAEGQVRALKILHAGRRERRRALGRLHAAFTTLATLPTGVQVVRVQGVGEVRGAPCLLMDRIEGRGGASTLADLVDTLGRAPERLQVQVAVDLANTLHALHEAGVAHRDLKLENVLLASDGGHRLSDFGLAAPLDGPAPSRFGTLAYAAPEQLAAGVPWVKRAHDGHALGTLLWRLGTGAWPFGEGRTVASVAAAKECGVEGQAAPGLSSDLEVGVRRLLEPDPARRAGLPDVLEAWTA